MKTIAFLLVISSLAIPETWQLEEPKVIASGTRDYRLTVDYTFSNIEGQVLRREQVEGTYTLTMPAASGVWKEVSIRRGSDSAIKLPYMQGLHCGLPNASETTNPQFFKDFPSQAFEARNMVWDAVMFLAFTRTPFRLLPLNQPFAFATSQRLNLAGTGAFENKDVELTWSGYSERNAQRCALIDYHAYFNPLALDQAGMKMKGRSHYWGQIWVSLATREIEYGTLNEDVLIESTLPGQTTPQVTNVFRAGIFAPANSR